MDVIVYHAGCPDGFCAAYVAQGLYRNAELLPMSHGQNVRMEQFYNKDVLVLDFSWQRHLCESIAAVSNSLKILDHHKSAELELQGLDYAVFDQSKSGATLTWDTLFPGQPRPWYVDYVEDRDLWKFALKDSVDISAYIMALPFTREAWGQLDILDAEHAAEIGRHIRLHIDHYVREMVKLKRKGKIAGLDCFVVNAPFLNCSDIGAELVKLAPVSLTWFEREDDMMIFSLRSTGDIDVSGIAKQYGGGGHKTSAGFQLKVGEGRTALDQILGR